MDELGSGARRVSDRVQEAATKRANEITDPIVLAMRGSGAFSLIFRLLVERDSGIDWLSRGADERIRATLDEIDAIVKRIRERLR